jgi:hypothetical protein
MKLCQWGKLMAKGGKPSYWDPRLWEQYQKIGEADTKTVKSMKRFLESMVEQHTSAVISLGRIMAQGIKKDRDPTHSYQEWYVQHIRWPKKDGQCPSVFKIETHMIEDERYESLVEGFPDGWKEVDVYHPWLLRVGLQLGKRVGEGTLPLEEVDVMGDPDNFQEQLQIDHHHRKLEEYLKSAEWREDEGTLETFTQEKTVHVRRPDETRKAFINRILFNQNFILTFHYIIQDLGTTAPHVPTKTGSPPSGETEDMLVRRMFGERPVDIYTDVGMKKENFYRATKQLAERLGFLPTDPQEKEEDQ